MISKKASQRSQRRNTKTKESKATKREVNLSSKLFPIMMCLTGSNNRIAGNSIFRFEFSLNQLFRAIGYSIPINRLFNFDYTSNWLFDFDYSSNWLFNSIIHLFNFDYLTIQYKDEGIKGDKARSKLEQQIISDNDVSDWIE